MPKINNGIINNYSIKPRNLTQYTAFRGVTDFTQIGQFAQAETGYSFLSILSMPRFMEELAKQDADIKSLVDSFKHMLEFEFKGLSGLPTITGDTYEISDGVNTQRLINKVTWDTSATVSSEYYEKTGGLISKFCELYLTGIKDRMSQAKTYHGLIKNGILEPGPENEVFTALYYVTDNTYLRIERAVLLCNCQFANVPALQELLESKKGEINNIPVTIEWNTFPIMGYEVDKAAAAMLQDITGVQVTTQNSVTKYKVVATENVAALDSGDYRYGIMDANSPSKIQSLVNAIGS